MTIYAGTGHRPNKLKYGYSEKGFHLLVSFAEQWLTLRSDVDYLSNPSDTTTVISGMALGWDMALAQAAVNTGVPFRAYIPFIGQESVWPEASQKLYHSLLGKAEVVKTVSPDGYAPFKMQLRNAAMVGDCNVVLALWNGTPGGTANCVKAAITAEKKIMNLWSEYEKFCEGK